MNMEQWLTDTVRGKQKSEKNLSQCRLVHHKSYWTDLGAGPGRRGEKPATTRLSYGTALTLLLNYLNLAERVFRVLVEIKATHAADNTIRNNYA
jgi:hypothetical protein